MRAHILSDLHNSPKHRFVPEVLDADVTILAGDIDEQLDGIAWAEKHFQGDIIYVPGNHEFYGGRVSRTLEKMKAAAGPRTHVLDRESVVLHGVRFLGAVGWTDYRASGNEHLAMLAAQNVLGDFKEIRHNSARSAENQGVAGGRITQAIQRKNRCRHTPRAIHASISRRICRKTPQCRLYQPLGRPLR